MTLFLVRFPGEGRGLVAQAEVIERSTLQRSAHNWAPAFAGEVIVFGVVQ